MVRVQFEESSCYLNRLQGGKYNHKKIVEMQKNSDSNITDLGLSIEPTLLELKDGTTQVVVTNSAGFKQRLDQELDRRQKEAEVVLCVVTLL